MTPWARVDNEHAPAAGMGEANEVEVQVLRLLNTARRGLQVTASPAHAIDMVLTDDETSPENCEDVANYLFPENTCLGRHAGIFLEVVLT